MDFKNRIKEQEFKRTIILLHDVRVRYGISTYLMLKKYLIVGIIIDIFQNTTHDGSWISYNTLLQRYERRYREGCLTHELIEESHYLYGFEVSKIRRKNLQEVEDMVIKRCMKDFKITIEGKPY